MRNRIEYRRKIRNKIRLIINSIIGIVFIMLLIFILIISLDTILENTFHFEELRNDFASFFVKTLINYSVIFISCYIVNALWLRLTISFKFRLTKVVKYFLIHFAICVLFELINLAISGFDNYLNVFNFKNFVFTLPFMISIISFQVFTEEFVSRGLVSEMIRKVINNKYLIYATGAFLFALFHTSNPWVLKNPAFLSFFFIDGLAYYYFYVEDNSLGIPFALHLSNNIYSFMFVGSIYEKPFFGILVNTDSSDPNILIGFIFLLFKYSVVFLFFKNEKNNAPGLLKPANEEIISESLKSS